MCNVCTQTCSCVKSLALGVGKIFLDRKGNKVKIVAQEQHPTTSQYKWLAIRVGTSYTFWFTDDGKYQPQISCENDLVTEYREPAVVYTNQYSAGFTGSLFTTKEACIANASNGAIRKGVKFVEVIEE